MLQLCQGENGVFLALGGDLKLCGFEYGAGPQGMVTHVFCKPCQPDFGLVVGLGAVFLSQTEGVVEESKSCSECGCGRDDQLSVFSLGK